MRSKDWFKGLMSQPCLRGLGEIYLVTFPV